jgi:AP-4 complex subunit epsilon-1
MMKKNQGWSREFDVLVRSIGECKSKAEEDTIIAREVEVLKPRLKEPRLDKRYLKELLVRVIYVEMLGHDASWAHVKALQACSETQLLTKKVSSSGRRHVRSSACAILKGMNAVVQVAYLASSLFLDYKSDTIILVVNTLQNDLRSDNYLIGKLPTVKNLCFRRRWSSLHGPQADY